MRERKACRARSSCLGLGTLWLLLTIASPSRAGFVGIDEIMLSAEQCDAAFLGSVFGPGGTSPLSFTSSVNVSANTFSYTLNPGSTYLGQAISLTTTGYYDATNSIWNWSSSGSLGTTSWNNIGSETITGDPLGNISYEGSLLGFTLNVAVDYSTLNFSNVSTGAGILSYQGHDLVTVTETDSRNFVTGAVTWSLFSVVFGAQQNGIAPPGGGGGSFDIIIGAPVPEPSSCALLGIGMAGVLGLVRRRRTPAAITTSSAGSKKRAIPTSATSRCWPTRSQNFWGGFNRSLRSDA
jgi:hypothetical protein